MSDKGFISDVLFLGNGTSIDQKGGMTTRFYLPLGALSKHIFICSEDMSQSVSFGKVIVEELIQKRIPSILIDSRGYLSSLALLLDNPSGKYMELWKRMEPDAVKARNMAHKAFDFHMRQLSDFGLGQGYISQIKSASEVAVFTPRSGKAIPLAVSSLLNAPVNFNYLMENKPQEWREMIDSLVTSLVWRLYPNGTGIEKEIAKLLNCLVEHAWINNIDLEGLAGLVRLAELIDEPPFGNIDGMPLDDFISLDQRMELTQRIYNFSASEKQLWYKGVPFDIDLLINSDKSRVIVVNISQLENYQERCFIMSRLLYSIYNWSLKRGPGNKPELFFYLDDIGGKQPFYPADNSCRVTKSPLELLISEDTRSGVCCMLGSSSAGELDCKSLAACHTWILGDFKQEKDREAVIEGAKSAQVYFDKMGLLLKSLDAGEFILRISSTEQVIVKRKCLASFHCMVPASFLARITDINLRESFKPFYVSGTISGAEIMARLEASDLTPQVIFSNFDFGVNVVDSFVLDNDPEDAIILCLKELAEEDIFVEEIRFKNVQLVAAQAHRGMWRADTLLRDSLGRPMDRVKDEGIYARFDTIFDLGDETKEKILDMVDLEPTKRCSEICRKVAVLLPDSSPLTPREVRLLVGRQISIPPKDIFPKIKEQNIAVTWKFSIEYRGRLIESEIDIINGNLRTDFPPFSAADAIDEVKKKYPDFGITDENISARAFYYLISYTQGDKNYLFKINRRSCKIMRQRVIITQEKAYAIAAGKMEEKPFLVRKYQNAWNFYYSKGVRLIVDEETGEAVFREVVAPEEVDNLSLSALTERTGSCDFTITNKEFVDGKWIVNAVSKKWKADLEINESGRVFPKLNLRRQYCLSRARNLLSENNVNAAMYKNGEALGDGWVFEFLSVLGDFKIAISPEREELIKKRLSLDGVKHFVELELGGTVSAINDKRVAWQVILKINKRIYSVILTKQNVAVTSIKVKAFPFWRSVDVDDVRKI